MRNISFWLLNFLILLALLFVSCTQAVPEEEEKSATEQEEVAQVLDDEEEKPKESQPKEQPEEEKTSEPELREQPPEEQSTEPQPEEPPPPEPQPIPEEPEVPEHKYQELALLALDLINQDRVENGLSPVVRGGNTASQKHAEENLANSYSSHWSLDGLKPYMRYTLAGGVNYVGENVFGTGASGGPSETRDPREMMEQAQQRLMDSPSHRANILNRWNKKVSLGIAYDDENFHLVQHFEGDYIGFSEVPNITDTVLSMAGKLKTGTFEQIAIHYDPLPQPLTPEQLDTPPYDSTYGLGGLIANILPPPPPGSQYSNLSPIDVVGTIWDTRNEGWFIIEADISKMFGEGSGIYTVVVVAGIGGEFIPVSNYSIFVQ